MAYQFDAIQTRDRLIQLIRALSQRQGFTKVVLGVSGGKDSSVAAALCARALGPDNVYGVMLPDGEQKDISDSIRVCEALGIRRRTINIGEMHRSLRALTDQLGESHVEGDFAIPYNR